MEIIILTLTRAAVYSLVAVGFVLVFSVGGILNLAHGTLFMLGAYFTYIFYTYLLGASGTIALLFAMLLSIIIVCLFTLFLYFVLFRRRIDSVPYVMVISLAVALFAEQVLRLTLGATSTAVPSIIDGSANLLGVKVLWMELLILPVAVVILGALWSFLHYTKAGKAIEAVAQNRDGAILCGIRTNSVLALTLVISSALAAVAGILISTLVTVTPVVWGYWLIKAFAIAILGGLGSLAGAVLAALILSFLEIATTYAYSAHYADLITLLVIVIALVFKPSGLMGIRRA
ncbi:MAG: branched-chain amino acid ABC transporter permease [Castellaniella sp.]